MEARALDEAKDFLAEILKDGPKPATEIFVAAKDEGHSVRTIWRAKKQMAIHVRRGGKGSKSTWSMEAVTGPTTPL